MSVFTVRRGLGLNSRELRLGGRVFVRGAELNTDDFPQFGASDWKRWEQHRLIESVGAASEAREKAVRRHAAELQRARDQYADAPITHEASPLTCSVDGCDFVANKPHGLLVHAGRKHG